MPAWRFNGGLVIGGADLSWFFARQIAMARLGLGPDEITSKPTDAAPTIEAHWDGSDSGRIPDKRLVCSDEQPAAAHRVAKKLARSKGK